MKFHPCTEISAGKCFTVVCIVSLLQFFSVAPVFAAPGNGNGGGGPAMCPAEVVCTNVNSGGTGQIGSAFISQVYSGYHLNTFARRFSLTISNISNELVSVSVTLFSHDGNLLVDDGSSSSGQITASYSFLNYDDSTGNVSFDLEPNKSIMITYNAGVTASVFGTIGYGTIDWSSLGSVQGPALLAHSQMYLDKIGDATKQSQYSVPINNGLPF